MFSIVIIDISFRKFKKVQMRPSIMEETTNDMAAGGKRPRKPRPEKPDPESPPVPLFTIFQHTKQYLRLQFETLKFDVISYQHLQQLFVNQGGDDSIKSRW
jgi:hypothetical protein